jgi:hypothetical protein
VQLYLSHTFLLRLDIFGEVMNRETAADSPVPPELF